MKIYLLCGKARSGKGLASSILKEELEKRKERVCEIQVTRTIKGYIKDYFGWDGNEDSKPRKLLQQLGNDIRKNDPNFHINRLIEDINILSNWFDVFIVSDVRFPLEIEEIKKKFSSVLAIGVVINNYVSPLTKEEANDITEHALDNYNNYDYIIINNDVDSLRRDIVNLLGGK